MRKITVSDLQKYSIAVRILFQSLYPDGLTLDQLKVEAETHGYLKSVLREVERGNI